MDRIDHEERKNELKMLLQLITLAAPGLGVADLVSVTLPTQIMGRLGENVRNKNDHLRMLYDEANLWKDDRGRPWLKPVQPSLNVVGGNTDMTITVGGVSNACSQQ